MQPLLLSIASILILVSCTQFVATGLSVGRRNVRLRTSRNRTMKNLRNAAKIARLKSEIRSTPGKQSAMDWRVMEVSKIEQESADAKSFYFVDPYRQPLPEFRPGQYLMVRPALAGSYQTMRCYSLSAAPNQDFWRITVKRQESETPLYSRSNHGGLSAWLHDNINTGDCLLIGGPSGHFFLPAEDDTPLVLLAAGVGITPMSSMLQWSTEHTPDRPVVLLYQTRDVDHWPLGPEVHAYQSSNAKCCVVSYMSRADAATMAKLSVEHAGHFQPGRIAVSEAVAAIQSPKANYYMCGPDAWMEAMRAELSAAGVAQERVHWESFGSGKEATLGSVRETSGACQVRFASSEIDAHWENPETSLWELAKENDVAIPSGCLSGVCGSCRVKLLKGTVTYDRKINIELGVDECLACIAHPETDITIDA